MNGNVVIKSFPNGISVKLSDQLEFSEILEETRVCFEKTASFFKDASIVLRFEGRELSDLEIEKLTAAILKASHLKILCVVCTNKEDNVYFSKLLEKVKKEHSKDKKKIEKNNTFQYHRGSLLDGDTFESDGNVLILGDVNKGAAVFAKGNAIVLGSIKGTVFAGKKDDDNYFIAAFEFAPENLKIGSVKYKNDLKEKLSFRKKIGKVAYVEAEKIVFSDFDFTKDLPDLNY